MPDYSRNRQASARRRRYNNNRMMIIGGIVWKAIFKPIGKAVCENGRYYIQLEERYLDAVLGLEDFSHIQVIWWFDQTDQEAAEAVHVVRLSVS